MTQINAQDQLGADDLAMETARVPENLPTPANSFVVFVVLCLFIFGLIAFAKFMEQRGRKRLGNKVAMPSRAVA